MSRWTPIMAALALLVGSGPASAKVTLSDTGVEDGHARRITIENDFVRLAIIPAQGGRIGSFIHKRTGVDLTIAPADLQRDPVAHWGLLSDQLWQASYWHNDLNRITYDVKVDEHSPRIARITLVGVSDLWTGIRIAKTITLRDDSSSVRVDYTFSAGDDVARDAKPDFWMHQTMPRRGRVFAASPVGVQTLPRWNQDESWIFEPTRGWIGWLPQDDQSTGLAMTIPFQRVKFIRATHRRSDTMEWILRKAAMRPGEAVTAGMTLAPLTGISHLDGVGSGTAVGMHIGPVTNGKAQVTLEIAPFEDQEATIDLSLRRLDGALVQRLEPIRRMMKADRPQRLELPLTIREEGSFVLAGTVRSGDDGHELHFEQPVTAGAASGTYAMAPEGPRIAKEPGGTTWSRYSPKDLDYSSLAVTTPHRPWAPRYAGGRPRVLALASGHNERQFIELAQRFDMDLTCAFLSQRSGDRVSTYYVLGDRVRNLKLEELTAHLAKVLERDYDVIITNTTDAWNLLPEDARATLLAKVEAGTGLVLASRGKEPTELAAMLPFAFEGYDRARGRLVALASPNPVARAMPYAAMSDTAWANGCALKQSVEGGPVYETFVRFDGYGQYPAIGAGSHGKGRVVQWTLGPMFLPDPAKNRQTPAFDYWEYQYALLARFVYWAARKESPVALLNVDCGNKSVAVEMTSAINGPAKLRITLRDTFGQMVHERTVDVELKNGQVGVGCNVPQDAIKRSLIADVIVTNDAGVLAWGAGVVAPELRGPTTFASLTPDRDIHAPDDHVTFTATFNGQVPLESSVRAAVLDGSGRIVARTEVDAFDQTTIELPLHRVVGPWYQVRAEYVMNGIVVDQISHIGAIRVKRRPDRLKTMFWGWAPSAPANVIESYFQQFIDMGMNANFGNRHYDLENPFFNKLNMAFSAQGIGMYANRGTTRQQRASPEPDKPQRVLAAADPDRPRRTREEGVKRGELARDWNLVMYSMGDENRGPVKDIGFSDAALDTFRNWLRETQYRSIDDLNTTWRTSFASWEQVMPMTEAEAREHGGATGSYAPWADHRLFIKQAYSRMGAAAVEGILSADPQALVGTSGTQESDVYGGRDWWIKARTFTALASYGGSQTIEQISFNPALVRYPWSGYSKPSPIIRAQLWSHLGQNASGFGIFSARTHINPDYTLPEAGRDLRAALLQITRGPGQLLMDATMPHDGVYLLQSPQSIHAAHMLGVRNEQRGSRSGVEAMLDDLAVNYRAISYEQLAEGQLDHADARVLILPWSVALSPGQCQAISRWVEAGGTLIADFRPGVMDEHAVVQSTGQLDALFGIDRTEAAMATQSWSLAGDELDHPFAVQRIESGVKPTSAAAMLTARQAGEDQAAPAFFRRQVGGGQAIYLGFDAFGAYTTLRRDAVMKGELQPLIALQNLMERTLASAEVKPALVVHKRGTDGGAPGVREPWISTRVKDAGPIRYVVLIRDYGTNSIALPDQPATVTFDRTAHVYDVLDGAYLGHGDALDLTIVDNTLRVLALLPYRVDHLTLHAPKIARPGDDANITVELVLSGDASPAKHWWRLDVIDPAGVVSRPLSADLPAVGGRAAATIPFAFNDPPGEWTVCVTDVATGVQARAVITLRR